MKSKQTPIVTQVPMRSSAFSYAKGNVKLDFTVGMGNGEAEDFLALMEVAQKDLSDEIAKSKLRPK